MSVPWMKFYPADWRADPMLRMCSLGARGLWMEMLCLMHESAPCGSLLVNGRPIKDKHLANLVGAAADEIAAFLIELEEAGVFSRDEDGTIYSRRMRRDTAKAARDRKNGSLGGNPNLPARVNPPVGKGDKAQKPEARSQSPETRSQGPEVRSQKPKPEEEEEDPFGPDTSREPKPPVGDLAEPSAAASSSFSKSGNGRRQPTKPYAFEAGGFRVTQAELQGWKEAYPNVNVRGELISKGRWAAEQRSPNGALTGWLAKKEREARLNIERVKAEASKPTAAKKTNPVFDPRL